ncbi:restriction endonuclease subunit S [Comamonas testosteroni]|uniref:restriction endonuclease subunit S n=1 Tax=Comamonas testosteroni TaxID=285 RepID=UPI00054D680D|nr:restriction endonuclease subunit S [Comamonas testosteroni]
MTTLAELCELITDCEHKTAPIQDEGYPSIRTPNIGRGRFLLDGVNRVSEATYQAWTKRAIPAAGDLILAREAPVGNVAVIPKGELFCLGQRTVLIRPKANVVDSDYLCYLLLTPNLQAQLLGKSGGATVHHINMKDIRALDMPEMPAINVQRRVATAIKNYDDLIATNQRRIALLEQTARLLYREWFAHLRFSGHESVTVSDGVPEGWSPIPLGSIATLNYGKALKAGDRKDGDVPVYGSSGIVGAHNQALVPAGAIVVGRKGNVGSLYLSQVPCYPIDTVFYIAPEQVSLWLFLALHQLNFISSDAAVPGLNRNYAHALPLLLPTDAVRDSFQQIVAPMYEEINLLFKQNEHTARARDLLLPKLMSGQLDVSQIPLPEAEEVIT